MKLIPVGTKDKPSASGVGNCFIVDSGKEKAVIDLGSGALSALQRYASPRDVSVYIITRMSYSRCTDVYALSMFGRQVVYAPCTPSERFSLLKAEILDTRVINSALRFFLGSMSFEFLRSAEAECYAVKISEGKNAFVYASDCRGERIKTFCKGAVVLCSTDDDARESGGKANIITRPVTKERQFTVAREGTPINLW